jgi:hypothetical protein
VRLCSYRSVIFRNHSIDICVWAYVMSQTVWSCAVSNMVRSVSVTWRHVPLLHCLVLLEPLVLFSLSFKFLALCFSSPSSTRFLVPLATDRLLLCTCPCPCTWPCTCPCTCTWPCTCTATFHVTPKMLKCTYSGFSFMKNVWWRTNDWERS